MSTYSAAPSDTTSPPDPAVMSGSERPTSRLVRWSAYSMLLAVLLLRLPQTHQLLLERALCTGSLRVGRCHRIGLYTAVAVGSVLSVQLWALASGDMPSTMARIAPVLLVSLVMLVAFHRPLGGLNRGKMVAATLAALLFSAAVSVI